MWLLDERGNPLHDLDSYNPTLSSGPIKHYNSWTSSTVSGFVFTVRHIRPSHRLRPILVGLIANFPEIMYAWSPDTSTTIMTVSSDIPFGVWLGSERRGCLFSCHDGRQEHSLHLFASSLDEAMIVLQHWAGRAYCVCKVGPQMALYRELGVRINSGHPAWFRAHYIQSALSQAWRLGLQEVKQRQLACSDDYTRIEAAMNSISWDKLHCITGGTV